MDNVFKYYDFSDFFKDQSESFSGNPIAYTELNSQHFLIFEKTLEGYNLYVSKFLNKKSIGVHPPEILELLALNYDKSIPEHRIILRKYLH